MIFNHNPLENSYWFEDCPMLNPIFIEFAKSKKKYLFAYQNNIGEYLGEFYDKEPSEDLFVSSYEKGDACGALFERDFTKEVDINNVETIENALNLIDQDVYDN